MSHSITAFARVFFNPNPGRSQDTEKARPRHHLLCSWRQENVGPNSSVCSFFFCTAVTPQTWKRRTPPLNLIFILLPSSMWLLVRRGAFPFHQVLHLALRRDPACQNLVLFAAREAPGCAEITGNRRLKVWEGRVVLAQAFKGVAVDGAAHYVAGLGHWRPRRTRLALRRFPLTGQSAVVGRRKLPLPAAHVLPAFAKTQTDQWQTYPTEYFKLFYNQPVYRTCS